MSDSSHAPRREPHAPEGALDMAAAGEDLLVQARALSAGRAARTLTPGAGAALKQTLLGLTDGTKLQDHQAPGPATLQVVTGSVTMGTASDVLALTAGEWAAIPAETHDLVATSDAVVLLTVAPDRA